MSSTSVFPHPRAADRRMGDGRDACAMFPFDATAESPQERRYLAKVFDQQDDYDDDPTHRPWDAFVS